MIHRLLSSEKFEEGRENGGDRERRRNRCVSPPAMTVAILVVLSMHQSFRILEFSSISTEEKHPESKTNTDGFLVNFTTDNVQNDVVRQWTCGSGYVDVNIKGRLPLPQEMRPLFNFTTLIRTNLKILVMGDSVGIQLSEYLQKIVLAGSNNNNNNAAVLKVAYNAGRQAAAIHVAAPLVPGGNDNSSSGMAMTGSGAIAGWRVTRMFLPDALGWALANYNRGWSLEDVEALRGFVSNATSSSPVMTTLKKNFTTFGSNRTFSVSASPSGDFDVFVFRIPSPAWSKLEEVTEETLRGTLELANQLFGVKVVVFTSIHDCNNILTQKDREEMEHRNRLVSRFARNWTQTHNKDNQKGEGGGGVHTVYVLDQGRLIDELMEWNARLLGFDTINDSYLDVELEKGGKNYALSVGQVCGERVSHNSKDCIRNAITHDGMHLCMNIIGPRIAAGLACQLQCAYHHHYNDITMDDPTSSSS